MTKKNEGFPRDIRFLEENIGYTFRERKYVEEALCHSSYANENRQSGCSSNERLEFLGDSVLSLVVSRLLFIIFRDNPEGDLTRIRADVVCTRTLSGFARMIALGDFLLLGRGEEMRGGRDQDTILENAFEALLAAVFLDSGGLDAVSAILNPLIEKEVRKLLTERPIIDPKSHLQEIVQEARGMLAYEIVSESGPDHDKHYVCEVRVDNNVMGRGEGTSKKKAEIAAAEDALRNYLIG